MDQFKERLRQVLQHLFCQCAVYVFALTYQILSLFYLLWCQLLKSRDTDDLCGQSFGTGIIQVVFPQDPRGKWNALPLQLMKQIIF